MSQIEIKTKPPEEFCWLEVDESHWWDQGDPFAGSTHVLAMKDANDEVNGATVFYLGLPVLVVTIDVSNKDVPYSHVWVMHDDDGGAGAQALAGFLCYLGEQRWDRLQEYTDGKITLEDFMEDGGEGHEIIGFVGCVAHAMKAKYNDLPEPTGY
jgi:hypothetical protein